MNKSRTRTKQEIEALPEVRQAAQVLRWLEERGLREPAIASGWTRGWLTGAEPSDIDVAYVGPVAYPEARVILRDVIDELGVDPSPWDIQGIWNAEIMHGLKRTVDNYLRYYINSIDSVYLAADGLLHDPTGFGFADAGAKVLRINPYDQIGRVPPPRDEVYICLEGCRRVAKFGWRPTAWSVERMKAGVSQWGMLSAAEREYFFNKKVQAKYPESERVTARAVYDQYGWGFVFDTP